MTNAANIKAAAAFADARNIAITHLARAEVDFDDISTSMVTAMNRVSGGHSYISMNTMLSIAGRASDIMTAENDDEKAKYTRRFTSAVGTLLAQVKDDHDDLCAATEFINLCVKRAAAEMAKDAAERHLATIETIEAALS